jgi:hypothetical protein
MAKKMSGGKIAAEIGAGLAAAGAAAAAGFYFYGSKMAKKHRKVAVKWAHDMKTEVLREVKSLKRINSKDLARAVDNVAETYRGVRSINAADLKRAASELKSNLAMVQQEIAQSSRKGVSRARVIGKGTLARGKKTVKKIVSKARKAARKSR